jgi:hypothetical protein
MEFRQRDD